MKVMTRLLITTSKPSEELHLLESDVLQLRAPAFLLREFWFTKAKRDTEETNHRKNICLVKMESERGH